jgi:serine phosphatase RsbU (regulator of sigma subunit)
LNLGFLGFIAAQALLLSRRSVRAYERFEALSYELEAANSQLEARVKDRTIELEHASERIRSLNRRLEAENARMGSELSVTRRLQELLLPTASELQQVRHELVPLDIAAISLPASEVGGDYYDVLPFADKLLIGIGDVTGHGLESGMVMLMTQMGVRTLLEANHHNPVDILSILNRSLYKNVMRMQAHKSLSLALLSYHYDASQATGKLTVSGQHETLLLFGADGTLSYVDTLELGFPLALEEDIRPFLAQMTLLLEPGAGVAVFSDGITEAPNPQGTLYGLSRLAEVISQHWHAPARSIRDAVLGDVYRFINDTTDVPVDVVRILHDQNVEDDITLLIVKQH